MSTKQNTHEKAKWWKSGYAWLVFGGPALVVIASLITVYIAVRGQDPLISREENTLKNTESLTTEEKNALEPAMRARNHAATGVNPAEH